MDTQTKTTKTMSETARMTIFALFAPAAALYVYSDEDECAIMDMRRTSRAPLYVLDELLPYLELTGERSYRLSADGKARICAEEGAK